MTSPGRPEPKSRGWSAAELLAVANADELHIAVRRPDGSLRPAVPIWVVTTSGQVYVRTWHRRDTGWFGRALVTGQAQITVGEVVADVTIEDAGSGPLEMRAAVDVAYRQKYGRYGAAAVEQMVGEEVIEHRLSVD